MEIIDVSGWEDIEIDASGSREKNWLVGEDGYLYLFKYPKEDAFGEIYAEYIAFLVGTKLFDLQIPEIKIAVRDGRYGVISKNFVDKQQFNFIEISDYFQTDFPEFDPQNLMHYKIDDALKIVKKMNMLREFFEMCLFDCIIANQDRHCENWGILEPVGFDSVSIFAPLYDNGSSLCCLVKEEELDDYLLLETEFEKYTRKARTLFSHNGKKRIKIGELIKVLKEENKDLLKEALKKFNHVEKYQICDIMNDINEQFISPKRKKLITELILYRIQLLNKLLEE